MFLGDIPIVIHVYETVVEGRKWYLQLDTKKG